MSIGERIIYLHRFHRCRSCFGHRFPWMHLYVGKPVITISDPCVRGRIIGIYLDGLAKVVNAFVQSLDRILVPIVTASHIEVMRLVGSYVMTFLFGGETYE